MNAMAPSTLSDEFDLGQSAAAPLLRKQKSRPPTAPSQSSLLPGETNAQMITRITTEAKQKKPSQNKVGENTFAFQCKAHQLPPVDMQFKLLKFEQTPRKDGKAIPKVWRFDFVWPEYKLIVEIDGGVWMAGGGAHSHPVDITRNMTKQNDAALEGFCILRFTPAEVKSGHAIAFTQRVLYARGWRR